VFYFKREAAAALLGCVAAVGVKPHFGGGFIDGAAVGEQRAVFYFEYHAFFLAGLPVRLTVAVAAVPDSSLPAACRPVKGSALFLPAIQFPGYGKQNIPDAAVLRLFSVGS